MSTRNIFTAENRSFWDDAEAATRRVATWPTRKKDMLSVQNTSDPPTCLSEKMRQVGGYSYSSRPTTCPWLEVGVNRYDLGWQAYVSASGGIYGDEIWRQDNYSVTAQSAADQAEHWFKRSAEDILGRIRA